jgi:STE24 endopeptidase
MTEGEIEAVFAHEAGHWRRKHILKGLLLALVITLASFYAISLLLHYEPFYSAFMVKYNPSALYAGFLILLQLFQLISFPASPLFSAIQRHFEYQADQDACTLSDGTDMKNALIKLTEENLGNPFPHRLDVVWNYSHPPLLNRISRLNPE